MARTVYVDDEEEAATAITLEMQVSEEEIAPPTDTDGTIDVGGGSSK